MFLSPSPVQHGLTFARLNDNKYEYAFSCFSYLIAGIIRYKQGATLDGFLLINQSFVSYMSDVVTLGKMSWWHPIDRYHAVFTCMYHFYSLTSVKSWILNLIWFSIGFSRLLVSRAIYENHDVAFAKDHIVWHLCSILMAIYSV
jgi:hypothetical protein